MGSHQPNFGSARLVIGEANFQTRQGMKSALAEQGLRNIVDTGDIGVIEEVVAADDVDLLICDTELAPNGVNDLVRRVRHHEVGANPFLVVITLANTLTKQSIGQIIDSGTDDLVAKPFSTGTLIDRMVNLTRARKPFVVTGDYVGPTRRQAHRPGTEKIPEIEVPNTFKMMAAGDPDPDSVRDEIDRSIALFDEIKLERQAVQLAYIADRMVEACAGGDPDRQFAQLAESFLSVATDLSRRLDGADHADVLALCTPMQALADRLVKAHAAPDARDMDRLPHMAADIRSALVPTEKAA